MIEARPAPRRAPAAPRRSDGSPNPAHRDARAVSGPHVLLVVRHPVGGIRTFFRYVYRTAPFHGWRFTLVAPEESEAAVMREDLAALDVVHVPLPRLIDGARFAGAVSRVVLSRHFDLVHAHGFTAAVAASVASRLRGTPLVVSCHDTLNDAQFRGAQGRARKVLLATALGLADRIHTVSDGARENLLRHLPSLRARGADVVTIRNGIEVAPFRAASARDLRSELGYGNDTFLVGFLGRFMAQKGFRHLVDAVARMPALPGLPRRIVVLAFGEDGFVREERNAVRARGLDGAIRFLPFVRDPAGTLRGLDVVAMPSIWEACSLLAMESMVAGVPLVATTCVGLGELLVDTPARVVPPGDPTALAEALADEMRQPTAAAARAFAPEAARRFDVNVAAGRLADLCLRTIEPRARPRAGAEAR